MHYAERREQLLKFIRKNGHARAVDLPHLFDVSIATIRRDLARLEKEGRIQRTRGGAVLEKRSLLELSYQERESRSIKKKQMIARPFTRSIDSISLDLNRPGLCKSVTNRMALHRLTISEFPKNIKRLA